MNGKARIDLIHGHGWPAYVRMIVVHGLTFAALGPPIGAAFSPGVIVYPVALIMAYVVSTMSAFIAGLLVGAAAPFVTQRIPLYLAGAIIGAVCAVAFPVGMTSIDSTGIVLMYAFAGAAASLICTRITKSVRREFLGA
jgi:hypothetical protein